MEWTTLRREVRGWMAAGDGRWGVSGLRLKG